MAITARVDSDRAEVWAGVQDPLNARATGANALGFGVEEVLFTRNHHRRRARRANATFATIR
jgi:hypothetical protein